MKYVGIAQVDNRKYWSEWHSGSTSRTYRSEGYDTREEAETWLKKQIEFAEEKIKEDEDYLIKTIVIQVDEQDLTKNSFGHTTIDYIFDSVLLAKDVNDYFR